MSVVETEKIDMMSTDPNSQMLWLSMVEDREWDEIDPSFKELQAKVNVYIGTILSGDLQANTPEAKGRTLGIRLICQHTPNADGMHILGLTKAGCQHYKIHFKVVRLDDKFTEIPITSGKISGINQVPPPPNVKKPWWKR